MQKIMITAALTGGGHGKEANVNLPVQPDEIIEDALTCREMGAAIVHIHARDKEGNNTMDLEVFREIHDGIKRSSDLIVELSTGGGPTLPVAEKIGPLSLNPELATLNTFLIVLSVKGGDLPVIFTRSEMEHTAKRAREMGVKPVMTILNFSCLEEAENLIEKGLIDKPYYFYIGLNSSYQGTLKGTPKNLMALVERLPEGAIFTVLAGSEAQLPLTSMSMLLGGHVRVGLEDSIYYSPGRLAKSNTELVARTVRIAKELNFEIATPDDGREILQCKSSA